MEKLQTMCGEVEGKRVERGKPQQNMVTYVNQIAPLMMSQNDDPGG